MRAANSDEYFIRLVSQSFFPRHVIFDESIEDKILRLRREGYTSPHKIACLIADEVEDDEYGDGFDNLMEYYTR